MILHWLRNWCIKNQHEEKLIQLYLLLFFKSMEVKSMKSLNKIAIQFNQLPPRLTLKKRKIKNTQMINFSREILKEWRRKSKLNQFKINKYKNMIYKKIYKIQKVNNTWFKIKQETVFWLLKKVINWMEILANQTWI